MYYVYVMSDKPNGMIYVGMTNDLIRKIALHKSNQISGFPLNYSVTNLVYFEEFTDHDRAKRREALFNKWTNRRWLISIIEDTNPKWHDLSEKIIEFA